MSKRYTLGDYTPLRPWERASAYLTLIVTATMLSWSVLAEGLNLRTLMMTAIVILSFFCAIVAFWDARTAAYLRRKLRRERALARREPSFYDGYWADSDSQHA